MPSAADAVTSTPKGLPKQAGSPGDKDRATLEELDAIVDKIRSLTAPDPYILTIPQDVEPRYHHSYQAQAMQWLHETPFRYHDGEMTQYQTFIYHEHGNGVYVLQSSRPSDEAADDTKGTTGKAGLGANTPKDGAPKKKISLNAYKKSKTGANTPATGIENKSESAPAVKQPAVKGPVERVKAETEEVLAAVAHEDALVPEEEEKKSGKRKREDSAKVRDHQSDKHEQSEAPAAKRPRPSSPAPASKHPKATLDQPAQRATTSRRPVTPPQPAQSHGEETGLPPKLSPLGVEPLPPRLSPTIPANIAVTLKARDQFRASSDDVATLEAVAKKDRLTPVRRTDAGITKRKSPVPKNAFRANSSSPAVGSDTEEKASARPAVTSVPQPAFKRGKTPELLQDNEIAIGQALKKRSGLLVKLKYKKHQREGIKRILNLRPQPDKVKTPPRESAQATEEAKRTDTTSDKRAKVVARDRREGNAKGVAQKIGPAPSATNDAQAEKKSLEANDKTEAASLFYKAEKRLPPSQTQSAELGSIKRKQVPDAIETSKPREPSTPVPSDLQSPSLLSSAQKSQQVTPSVATTTARNHLLPAAVAMQRERSSESSAMAVDSPTAMSIGTPASTSQQRSSNPNRSSAAPSSQPSTTQRRPKHPGWEARQKRLESLGRDLKHAASAHLSAREPRLAAIKSLESLLAYILAFTCADEANLHSDPKQPPEVRTWRSLLGFFAFVKRNTEPYPLLFGLTCALGMVFNARILEICTLHPAEGLNREGLLETFALLQKCAGEAAEKLDVETLKAQFPKAWKARTASPSKRDDEEKVVDPEQTFVGGFELPLGVQTSPLRAARAGHTMLQEWVDKEKVDYQLKLKL